MKDYEYRGKLMEEASLLKAKIQARIARSRRHDEFLQAESDRYLQARSKTMDLYEAYLAFANTYNRLSPSDEQIDVMDIYDDEHNITYKSWR